MPEAFYHALIRQELQLGVSLSHESFDAQVCLTSTHALVKNMRQALTPPQTQ